MDRVLITGGNGLIGSHLAEELFSRGHNVILYDIHFDWRTSHLVVPKIQGSVLDRTSLERIIKDVDTVVHLGGVSRVEDGENDPSNCLHVNIEGGHIVAEISARLGKRLIFGSSREVYGNPSRLPVKEEDPKHPISTYGVAKLAVENLLETLSLNYGLRYTILRFSNVYGSPRDRPERVIPKFFRRSLSGEPLELYGGKQLLDFSFVDDVASVITSVIDLDYEQTLGQDFNIITGRSHSILELAGTLKRLTNSGSELVVRPPRSYDPVGFEGDPTKIKSLLTRSFKIRSLQEGLSQYVQRMPIKRSKQVQMH